MVTVKFYFDEMMSHTVAKQLRNKGYELVVATEVGMVEKDDPEHLTYATEHGYVMVTFDRPFTGKMMQSEIEHAGLICLSGRQNDIGYMVRTLQAFTENYTPETTYN